VTPRRSAAATGAAGKANPQPAGASSAPVIPGALETELEPKRRRVGPADVYHYDVGTGPAVLMLHGWNHHAEAWIRNIGPVARAGFRVVALDLPGFGRSGMPHIDYSLRGYARFVTRFLDGLGIDRAALVGSSLGGAIAFKTAIDHPSRVSAVVGVDPAGMFERPPRLWSLLASPALRAVVRPFVGRRRILEESHKNAYFDKTLSSPQQVDVMAEAHLQPGYRDHFMAMAQSLATAPAAELLWEGLPSLTVPVMVVWGRQDRTLPVQHAYRAAQRIPGSELVLYDQSGHLPMYEKAEDFNRDLVDFLHRSL
jgi:4,5:9,10-diseco-3-hydroxy-5,9,17-trioxoandrosta-1(10),2-diene-4-oate hydrolase